VIFIETLGFNRLWYPRPVVEISRRTACRLLCATAVFHFHGCWTLICLDIRHNWPFFAISYGWDVVRGNLSKSAFLEGRWVTFSADFRVSVADQPLLVSE